VKDRGCVTGLYGKRGKSLLAGRKGSWGDQMTCVSYGTEHGVIIYKV